MILPLRDADPLASWITLCRLEALLRTASRPDHNREGWVELLVNRKARDWRVQLTANGTRAAPLRPDGRAYLPRADWKPRARGLLVHASVVLEWGAWDDVEMALIRPARTPSQRRAS